MRIPSVVIAWMFACVAAAAPTYRADIDARELPRKLLHARLEIAAQPGKVTLWYPKWIPGVHAPAGPVENIGGLRFETVDGKAMTWRRDPVEMQRFVVDVPAGHEKIVVKLDYICNQPNNNSSGVDSWGNASLGIVNFNTVLMYREGDNSGELGYAVSVRLPVGWKHGSALPVDSASEGVVKFRPSPLVEVIDSPLITGEHLRTIPLKGEGVDWKVYLHVVSESESAIRLDEKRIGQYNRLVTEAAAMFGAAHFPDYHFLLVCSDEVGRIGVEHHASSLNAVGERDIVDDKRFKDWASYLLPHEFVHSWCGKYRRPAAMATTDYHTPQRTALLWIYEGLTQHLGEVLTVRSGMLTLEEHREKLARKISGLMRQEGRKWRSLEDTAVASWTVRAHSRNWPQLRRSQDYYNEGLLVWMECDTIIREKTDGKKSLDDFCRAFFGPGEKNERVVGYTFEDVVKTLNSVAAYDWATLLHARIDEPLDQLSLEYLTKMGYRLTYVSKTPKLFEDAEGTSGALDATDSVGLTFTKDGKVSSVVPGMAGDKAGLAPDEQVVGVNGLKFSRQRMKDAIADSVTKRGVELLMLEGEKFRTVKLDYADGLKYMALERDASKADGLAELMKPLKGK
jgi:predicted metalloprotease with PDZ domain